MPGGEGIMGFACFVSLCLCLGLPSCMSFSRLYPIAVAMPPPCPQEPPSGTGDCMVLRGILCSLLTSDCCRSSSTNGSCQVGRASWVLCFVSLCFVWVFHPMSFSLFPLLLQPPPPPHPPPVWFVCFGPLSFCFLLLP